MSQTPNPPAGWYPQGNQERWWDGSQWSDNIRPRETPTQQPGQQPGQSWGQSWGQSSSASEETQPYGRAQGSDPASGSTTPQVPYGAPSGQSYQGQPYQGQPYAGQAYGSQPGQPYAGQYPPAYGHVYAPPRRSHTARNILIVLGIIFLLGVGGCVALVAVVSQKVDSTLNDQTPGGPNKPLTITPGQPFSVRDLSYAAGWSVGTDEVGDATVTDLKVTNNGDPEYLFVHVDLRQGQTILATVNCSLPGSLTKLASGDTVTLDCYGTDTLPTAYDRVTINDDF